MSRSTDAAVAGDRLRGAEGELAMRGSVPLGTTKCPTANPRQNAVSAIPAQKRLTEFISADCRSFLSCAQKKKRALYDLNRTFRQRLHERAPVRLRDNSVVQDHDDAAIRFRSDQPANSLP